MEVPDKILEQSSETRAKSKTKPEPRTATEAAEEKIEAENEEAKNDLVNAAKK